MSGRLGTPVGKKDSVFLRSDAPSPTTPFIQHQQLPSSPVKGAAGAPASPLKLKRATQSGAVAQNGPHMSPALSVAGSQAHAQTQSDLKHEIDRLRARTRIVADPSISTSFKRDEDPELYDLFLR